MAKHSKRKQSTTSSPGQFSLPSPTPVGDWVRLEFGGTPAPQSTWEIDRAAFAMREPLSDSSRGPFKARDWTGYISSQAIGNRRGHMGNYGSSPHFNHPQAPALFLVVVVFKTTSLFCPDMGVPHGASAPPLLRPPTALHQEFCNSCSS